jgi:anti-anti-sigma factor
MNGVLVIAFEDTAASRDDRQSSLRENLYRSIESHPDPRFALDFSAINYMASSDIGFLLTLKRRIDARKGTFVLFEVDPYIVDALRTMKLLTFFPIVETRSDALVELAAG